MHEDEREKAPLWDRLKYARRVLLLAGRTQYEAYCMDWTTQMAMERALEVIGEAARRVPKECRASHSEIPWDLIIGQRNILAHEYGEVRSEPIWETATVQVPALVQAPEAMLPGASGKDTEQ